MSEIRQNVKHNLGYYLALRGISQKELADKLNVTQSAVTNWIKGKNSPDIEIVATICEVLNISVIDLFGTSNIQQTSLDTQALLTIFEKMTDDSQHFLIQMAKELYKMQKSKNK
jgi:transcriptional regulator with XRE-family HTH domain